MKKICLGLIALVILQGCGNKAMEGQFSEFKSSEVVYGDDGRVDASKADNRWWQLSQSTAIQIPSRALTLSGDIFLVDSTPLFEKTGICEDQKFAKQSAIGRCSGFLVGEDILVTAGHCIQNQSDCTNNVWAFDYVTDSETGVISTIKEKNVFHCQEIIHTVLENSRGMDFAIIKLDKKVEGRKALKVRESGEIKKGEKVVVIGNPSGLPTKITLGGSVRDSSNSIFFVANVDTFGGNSGSAVFNESTGLVEGILVRGEADYVYDSKKGCQVINKCSEDGCRGEDITKISFSREIFKDQLGEEQEDDNHGEVTIFKSDINLKISDFLTTTYTFLVEEDVLIKSFTLDLDIEHSYVGDLIIWLESPDGTQTTLRYREGRSQKNLKAKYELTSYAGNSSKGKYKLIIKDMASRDEGWLKSALLKITY